MAATNESVLRGQAACTILGAEYWSGAPGGYWGTFGGEYVKVPANRVFGGRIRVVMLEAGPEGDTGRILSEVTVDTLVTA